MITRKLSWSTFKSRCSVKALAIQFDEYADRYDVWAVEYQVLYIANLIKGTADATEFEAGYKAGSNQPIIPPNSMPPFGNKTIIVNGQTKKLFARFTGVKYPLVNGNNTLDYSVTFPWVKIVGIEVVNAEALDTASLYVYDNAQGTYSGVPNQMLNQFSYALNLGDGLYQRMAQFDADLYQGMVLRIIYNAVTIAGRQVGINYLMNEVKS